MEKETIVQVATRFRNAIEKARDAGEFASTCFHRERMNQFPKDCCDDTADLFAHYLYLEYGIDSIRVDGSYYDNKLGCTYYHSWQEVEGLVIDLTGDQFENDDAIPIKAKAVYVGKMDAFQCQFIIQRRVHSCGIESLGSDSQNRMYALYQKISKYI